MAAGKQGYGGLGRISRTSAGGCAAHDCLRTESHSAAFTRISLSPNARAACLGSNSAPDLRLPAALLPLLRLLLLPRYENTEKRMAKVAAKGILYMGMGVSGGEEGARRGKCRQRLKARRAAQCGVLVLLRSYAFVHVVLAVHQWSSAAPLCSERLGPHLARTCIPGVFAGPSMMPGGSPEAYSHIKSVVEKVAAQVRTRVVTCGGPGNSVTVFGSCRDVGTARSKENKSETVWS